MGTFFTSWPGWEAMVLILGLGSILVAILAWFKLYFDRFQLGRATQLENDDIEMQALPRPPVPGTRTTNHSFFGSEAIQAGIRTTGTWLFGSTPPAGSSRRPQAQAAPGHDSAEAGPSTQPASAPRSSAFTENLAGTGQVRTAYAQPNPRPYTAPVTRHAHSPDTSSRLRYVYTSSGEEEDDDMDDSGDIGIAK